MRVVITNGVISNAGDSAILHGIVESLRLCGVAGDADIAVFDSNAARTALLYPEWQIRQQMTVQAPGASPRGRVTRKLREAFLRALARYSWLGRLLLLRGPLSSSPLARSYQVIAESDVVISTGGTYLVDHYPFAPRITELEIALSLGKPVYLWTQSMGPFETEDARTSVGRLNRRLAGAFFRDEVSRQSWLSRNEAPPRSEVVPDVAFALGAPASRPTRVAGSAPLALLSVREWAHRGARGRAHSRDSYIAAMRSLAKALLDSGWRVSAVSTCQGLPGYATDDSSFAVEIFNGLDVVVDRSHHRPRDLQVLVSAADLVVSTRMHLAILALIGRTPVAAVAYEFKTLELFASLGLSANCVAIEAFDEAWALALVRDLRAGLGPVVLADDDLARLRDSAAQPAKWLAADLIELGSAARR